MRRCEQCDARDRLVWWPNLRVRLSVVTSFLFGVLFTGGLVVHEVQRRKPLREDLSVLVLEGAMTGAMWYILQRAKLHHRHAQNRLTLWVFTAGKLVAVTAVGYLVGLLLP